MVSSPNAHIIATIAWCVTLTDKFKLEEATHCFLLTLKMYCNNDQLNVSKTPIYKIKNDLVFV